MVNDTLREFVFRTLKTGTQNWQMMSAMSAITSITLPPSPEEGVGHYPKLFRWGFAARRTKLPILMRETTSFAHRKLITQCLCKPDRVKMYPFSDQIRCWKNLTLCGCTCTYLYWPHKAAGLPLWLERGRCARNCGLVALEASSARSFPRDWAIKIVFFWNEAKEKGSHWEPCKVVKRRIQGKSISL